MSSKTLNFKSGSPLLNLALLESLKSEKFTDELDLYLPFIAAIIIENAKPEVKAEDIQETFSRSFGFAPPLSVVKSLLMRAKKRGLLQRQNEVLLPVYDKLKERSQGFDTKRERISDSMHNLKLELVGYAKNRFNKDITLEESESLIVEFIESNVSSVISSRYYHRASIDDKIKNTDHMIASFIGHIHKNDAVILEHFNTCVKGMLLAGYLFYADKFNGKLKYENITVYLDTPLIVGLLGFNGAQKKKALNEFIKLLNSLNVKVFIFDKTLYEIEGLLGAWQEDLAKGNYFRFNTKTLELLKLQGYDAERLASERKILPGTIEKLGVTIKYGFTRKSDFNCDELALEEAIKKNFRPEKNLSHDIECISRIHNMREGRPIKGFNEKFSIFVTPNTGLVKRANEFFSSEISKSDIPITVSDQWITTIFWLKKPDIYSSLPLEQVLSNAYSVLYTDDKFWDSFINRLEKIVSRQDISQEEFKLIRWDSDLLNMVHEASVDVGENFSEEDIFDIVERIRKKNETESDKKLVRVIAQNAAEIDAKEKEIVSINTRYDKASNNIKRLADTVSNCTAWFFSLALFSVVMLAVFTSLPDSYKPNFFNTDFQKGWKFLVCLLLYLVFDLLGKIFGVDIKYIHDYIKIKVRNYIINKLIS